MTDIEPRRLVAWQGFLFAHAAVTKVLGSSLEQQHGLPLTWYDVLVNLAEADDGQLRMHELAERVVLSQSGISRLVDRMERAGLVVRRRCDRDARVTWAVMTEAGRTALHQAAPTHFADIGDHFARHLTDEEAEAMAAGFEKILEHLDSPRRPTRPEPSSP